LIPAFSLALTELLCISDIPESEQTDAIKTNGGYLLTRTYKEAWSEYWGNLDINEKNKWKNLPGFDPDVFKEITGIDVQ
jgi:hypothetical protein